MQWRLHGLMSEAGKGLHPSLMSEAGKGLHPSLITPCDFQQAVCLSTSQSLHPLSWESSLPSLSVLSTL